ncbi:hypothetical protein [Pseudomonas petrae]|uniref:Uncharacterized protein n=1 Tax=Pseudomonas petrae TaxID=2912190 RepID=A0ABS9I9Y7_9PSED|nr:hypothetical protein [Pseudomonas petrae]MCF7535291.1 hypothetical protein [Pseudomonas petrae]MCF7539051.1 hypothetical protein [Pseudomonas petrae]MCF7544552.1 hypothetical protein [Pseudomonas petrae]MCF7556905.1 hypothetical protein [Pseudomonas petrae]
MMQVQMQVQTSQPDTFAITYLAHDGEHFGGDRSPLNDADSDEDRDPEGELDLSELDLDEFADADKLDISSSNLE